MNVTVQRIYVEHSHHGYRVLVDRLWPRGVSKQSADLVDWWKDIAPSPSLRAWFDLEPERWGEFRRRYLLELERNNNLIQDLMADVRGDLVLLFDAKNEQYSHALILKEHLEQHFGKADETQCASPPCYDGAQLD